jgi:hypothetical protein
MQVLHRQKHFMMVLGWTFHCTALEYRPADSRWGVMLQAGYDSRKGDFDRDYCDCPADLSTNLSYITEPSLRFAPFKSNFYLYGGPRLAFNLINHQLPNPDKKLLQVR